MRAWLPVLLVAGVAHAAHMTPAGHNFGFDDMVRLKRLGGFDVARDGKSIVYAVTTADVDENKTTSALWLTSLDGKTAPRQLTA
ncbi:MAG TPA: S9 family peptidase, partial [Polyangia bacterium]|nr:S9 family peptidase [Polyangia bacterium]